MDKETTEFLADLKAKAMAAESVEDEIESEEDLNPTIYHEIPIVIDTEMWENMATSPQDKKFLEAKEAFLNAATPTVVLWLIEMVRELEQRAKESEGFCQELFEIFKKEMKPYAEEFFESLREDDFFTPSDFYREVVEKFVTANKTLN